MPELPEPPLVGDEFAGYRLRSVLGRGGMSVVYQAENPRLGSVIALKVLAPQLATDDIFRARFLEESRIAASLNHPNVIPIYDMGSCDGLLYIAMRFVSGTDLRQVIKKRGRVIPSQAVFLLGQAARALDAAHRQGLVHRDVKPGNLLIERGDDDGDPDHVYLADFGITKHAMSRSGLTSTGQFLGTIDYVAPEQIQGLSVLGLADQYSLGCVLYECLTGRVPFEKDLDAAIIFAHVTENPTMPTVYRPELPAAVDEVFSRVLAKEPGERYGSCREFIEAARVALGSLATEPEPGAATGGEALRIGPGPTSRPAVPAEAWPGRQGDTVVSHRRAASEPAGATGGPARGPKRGPAWRRFGVPILVAAAALAVAIVLVLVFRASPGTKTGGASAGPSPVSVPGFLPPTVAGTVPVGGSPNYVQVAPNGQFAYITNPGTRTITVLNTATDRVSGTIPIPQGPPQAVSFSPDSRTAYVSVYGSHSAPLIAFIDTAAGKVTSTVPVDNHEPGPSATSTDGLSLYVPNHNDAQGGAGDNVLDVINLATKKVIQSIPVKANPHWVVVDNKNGLFYVTDHQSAVVTVLDAKTNRIITTIQTGETPHSAALSPDGSRLAVTSYNGNAVFLINTATDQMIKQIPVGTEPLDITYSPDGRYLFTANNLNNTVTVIDTAHNLVIAEIPTGKAPTSISVLPNGRQAYVTDENSGAIEILNLPE
jgi:YVTN family beta-propeller protein